jgi:hypothetical protein
LFSATSSPLPLRLTLPLAVLGMLTTSPLSPSGLPTTYQTQTFRILAVPLVPAAWLEYAAASLAKAGSPT